MSGSRYDGPGSFILYAWAWPRILNLSFSNGLAPRSEANAGPEMVSTGSRRFYLRVSGARSGLINRAVLSANDNANGFTALKAA